jgi:transposase
MHFYSGSPMHFLSGVDTLARWYVERTSGTKGARKTTMIVALARKLLIALWRLATTGPLPDGVVLRSEV